MKENSIAKALQIIGIVVIACGVILGFITLANGDELAWVGIVEMIVSFIICMIFFGFAEIIELLQRNVNKQEDILSFLKEKPDNKNIVPKAPKTVLQDIESNLPEM